MECDFDVMIAIDQARPNRGAGFRVRDFRGSALRSEMAAERGVGITAGIGPTAFDEINRDIAGNEVTLEEKTKGIVAKERWRSHDCDRISCRSDSSQREFGRFCSSFDNGSVIKLERLAVSAQ